MTEDECELLFQGHEDAQGNINYEGKYNTANLYVYFKLRSRYCKRV